MSKRSITKVYPPWPGVEAYSALVVIEDRGATIIEGLFDIDDTDGQLSINVFPANEKLCVDFELFEQDPAMLISVVLVRKVDGKCMQLLEYAYTEDFDETNPARIIFRDGRMHDSRPYSTHIVICDVSVERTDGERVLTGWESLRIQGVDWDESRENEDLSSSQLLREWADGNTWI
jgi:hypothetical protein